jgi:signal transduction histidine kinase
MVEPAGVVEAVSGVRLSLWRAAAGFRVAAAAVCVYLIIRWQGIYARPAVALVVGGGIFVATAAVVVLALLGRAHRLSVGVADLVVTCGLTLLSVLAQTPGQQHGGMPTLTTVWAAGPVIEIGLVAGWFGGLVAGVVQFAASVIVRAGWDGRTLLNGALLLIVGAVAGYVATRSRRAELNLAEAVATASAAAERERLARSIHDGVLQVLALVHRKGLAAGGEWAELAAAAAAQEAALRGLITRQAVASRAPASLTEALTALRSEKVTVSLPAEEVRLPERTTAEIVAMVRAALHNVAMHAGNDTRAWVLLEDLGDSVCVSVRDDGVGVTEQRIAEAKAEGRIGIASSIRGRAAELGGTAIVRSEPGSGTEVEVVVPRGSSR